ncbi:MAG: PAS domain S-box protein, partial [Gaiellaceae bacterium]
MGERGKLRDRGDAAAGLAEPRDLSERLLQEATRWIPVVDGAERSLLVFVADEQMRYVAVSESVCDLLGYRQEELLALGVTDVAVEETAAAEYTELVEAGVRVGLATIRARDGRLFDFSYSATEVALDGQRLFASVGQVLEGGNLAGRTAGDLR